MLVLYPLGPSYSQILRDIIPNLAIVEPPPLPSAVLSGEALYNLSSAGMFVDVGRAVEDDIVNDDD